MLGAVDTQSFLICPNLTPLHINSQITRVKMWYVSGNHGPMNPSIYYSQGSIRDANNKESKSYQSHTIPADFDLDIKFSRI